jgi:hypothetical protein
MVARLVFDEVQFTIDVVLKEPELSPKVSVAVYCWLDKVPVAETEVPGVTAIMVSIDPPLPPQLTKPIAMTISGAAIRTQNVNFFITLYSSAPLIYSDTIAMMQSIPRFMGDTIT